MGTLWERTQSSFFKLFYYPYASVLNYLVPTQRLNGQALRVRPGIARPMENEQAIAEFAQPGDRVLDVGCGCGVLALSCAAVGATVLAVDINPVAVENTRENAAAFGMSERVEARVSDMFDGVEGRFDLIVCNAPYYELKTERLDHQWATSVRVLPGLFEHARQHLKPKGRLVVQQPLKKQQHLEQLARAGGLRLVNTRRNPRKTIAQVLFSLMYQQFGYQSTCFIFQASDEHT